MRLFPDSEALCDCLGKTGKAGVSVPSEIIRIGLSDSEGSRGVIVAAIISVNRARFFTRLSSEELSVEIHSLVDVNLSWLRQHGYGRSTCPFLGASFPTIWSACCRGPVFRNRVGKLCMLALVFRL